LDLDKISLRALPFYAYHGVLPAEQTLGQRFVVNLDLFLDLSIPGHSDNVRDTVNYAEVYEQVKTVMEFRPFQLIEALAEQLAADLLRNFPKLMGVRVNVEKPAAPIAGIFDSVGVTIERWHENAENPDGEV
jgi:dihydroneopterin aldolase